MSANISAKAIETQILNDINACNTLLDILEQEQEALASRDADALARIIEEKIQPLSQLEESANQRAQWAQALPGEKLSDKWNGLLTQLAKSAIKDQWEKLKTLTRACQQKNETNGKILARQQQVYGRLMELMRGQTRAPSLYDAAGSATGSHRSFKLDEA